MDVIRRLKWQKQDKPPDLVVNAPDVDTATSFARGVSRPLIGCVRRDQRRKCPANTRDTKIPVNGKNNALGKRFSFCAPALLQQSNGERLDPPDWWRHNQRPFLQYRGYQ